MLLSLYVASICEKQFCSQLDLMPSKLSRPEAVTIFRRAVQEYSADSDDRSLAYPEFIELLAFVADYVFRCVRP